MDLFHCFGATPDHRVDARLAVRMLAASRCHWMAVNTHTVNDVSDGGDLPIGYATATLGAMRNLLPSGRGPRPVLNINHPTTAAEAVARTRRAVALTGIRTIKLEVLDEGLTLSRNDLVIEAARRLVDDGLDVWPLITPDRGAFRACVEMGSTMVRVMGSPIGSGRGIDRQWLPELQELLAGSTVPVMLDGGIGSPDDVRRAADLGFGAVLVNSCLFGHGRDPVMTLRAFRAAVDAVTRAAAVVP